MNLFRQKLKLPRINNQVDTKTKYILRQLLDTQIVDKIKLKIASQELNRYFFQKQVRRKSLYSRSRTNQRPTIVRGRLRQDQQQEQRGVSLLIRSYELQRLQ